MAAYTDVKPLMTDTITASISQLLLCENGVWSRPTGTPARRSQHPIGTGTGCPVGRVQPRGTQPTPRFPSHRVPRPPPRWPWRPAPGHGTSRRRAGPCPLHWTPEAHTLAQHFENTAPTPQPHPPGPTPFRMLLAAGVGGR